MAAIPALTGLAGSLGLMGGGLAANRLNQGYTLPSFEDAMKETEDIIFFFQKKDDEHFPRHDIISK